MVMSKFIVVNHNNRAELIINDYKFYFEHQDEIDQWCMNTFDYLPRQGMLMSFNSITDLEVFLLRWN
jgi:hypothetical protein